MTVTAGVERLGHPELGNQYGETELAVSLTEVLGRSDLVVDFALSEGLADRVQVCARAGRGYICGVTGLDSSSYEELRTASRSIPVLYAQNFSVGVHLLARLAAHSRSLLGQEYDIEIIETHHRAKRDAPSGTAALLVEAILETADVRRVRNGRSGMVGAKEPCEIGVHSVRTGDVVGDHTVVIGGPGERIELTHRATSRQAFARGVVLALRFCAGREPGFYGMPHVLGAGTRT